MSAVPAGLPATSLKSAEAFRTISEVAFELDVPQHVLRFWETRFTQIKPLKRGGGRRYYRPDDVALLKGIRRLLYGEGYTIKGLQRILKEQGPRHVQAIGRGAPIGPAQDAGQPAMAAPCLCAASITLPMISGVTNGRTASCTRTMSSGSAAVWARALATESWRRWPPSTICRRLLRISGYCFST